MADVRSLLKQQRAARRVQHKDASYSSTGILTCTVCKFQIKSESLWEGHIRSAGHVMRLSKSQEKAAQAANSTVETDENEITSRKRKASRQDDGGDTVRKRSRTSNGQTGDGFDREAHSDAEPEAMNSPVGPDIIIPSRPATPLKPKEETTTRPTVDEDEWAAFEADIAALQEPIVEAIISAPAMTTAEIKARSMEESNAKRKERQEAELEGDKEDAARKLEVEFEEMEGLEARVRRLRERREALRSNSNPQSITTAMESPVDIVSDNMQDDEEIEEDDGWEGFRLTG